MKIFTYNINGIRSAISKGFADWLQQSEAGIICLQEIKLSETQLVSPLFENLGYHCYWYPAQKKGYSGVAILSKIKPLHVEYGCGIEVFDNEGRIIRADFENFSIISIYFPSGSSGDLRQEFKMKFLDDFFVYINELKSKIPNLIISGDYNICHKEIDIHNPKSNSNSSGFLPDEREWFGKFIDNGFIDSFRQINSSPQNYTWWSFRAGARSKNLGWRIDYHLISNQLRNTLKHAEIHPHITFSDHCPVLIEID